MEEIPSRTRDAPEQALGEASQWFAALGHPVRVKIVLGLEGTSEVVAGELVRLAGVSQPEVSRHLQVLTLAGMVAARTDGRKRFYRLLDPHLPWKIRALRLA